MTVYVDCYIIDRSDEYVVTMLQILLDKQNLEVVTKPPGTLTWRDSMRPEVIGTTTAPAYIAEMLGVEKDSEYGMYEESQEGKYFARLLPDGSFDSKLVRLITDKQADKLEADVLASIERVEKGFPYFAACIPIIRMERFNRILSHCGKQGSDTMGSNLPGHLDVAGSAPSTSNR